MSEIANLTDTTANLGLTMEQDASICAALPRSSNGKTTDSDSVAQQQESSPFRNLDDVCSSPETAKKEDYCELAPNGMLFQRTWNDYFQGYLKIKFFDKDYYAMWLEKEAVAAGNGLDKSDWQVAHRPQDFTYFARATQTGRIKIGRSRNPKRRMRDLLFTQYERIELLVAIPDGGLEWHYLQAYAPHQIEGEWFAPHPDIMAEIDYLREINHAM